MHWLVGITTCPRPNGADYLANTMASCQLAGWESVPPPIVSEDSGQTGAWRAWLTCLRTLVDTAHITDAAVLLLQDDVLLAKGLRQYLQRSLMGWMRGRYIVSLFTPGITAAYIRDESLPPETGQWYLLPGSWMPRRFPGACALAMPISTARCIAEGIGNPSEQPPNGAGQHLGQCCLDHWIRPYVHVPSLAEHVGDVSVAFAEHQGSPVLTSPMRRAGIWCKDVAELG